MAALNQDAFTRLRWPVFDSVQSIQVANRASDVTSETTPFSAEHSLALQPASEPAVRKIYFTAEILGEYEGDWDEPVPTEHPQRPAVAWDEVMVKRADGGPLLVGDVVMQLHQYFQRLRNKILEAMTPTYNIEHGQSIYTPLPENLQVFFGGFQDQKIYGDENVMVLLRFEGMDGMTMDQHWSNEQPKAADATQSSRGASQYPFDHQNATFEERAAWGDKGGLLGSLKNWPPQGGHHS